MNKYPLQAVYLGYHNVAGDSMYPVRIGRIYAACWAGNISTYLELRDVEDILGGPCWAPSKHFLVMDNAEGPAAVYGESNEH